ncbi:DUF397 domain-containing protein [Streptomyces globisporus]|uniref:DUF397 domain-containing protein n=1 Tax=Streptomyces globisporus TaxID=1908 RepID=A0A423V718_STRGL|nr:DUF397 domain-containing protein [Streptomyces globisporus]
MSGSRSPGSTRRAARPAGTTRPASARAVRRPHRPPGPQHFPHAFEYCIEVTDGHPGVVPVRDSKDPSGPAPLIAAPAWTAFVEFAAER